MIDLINIPLWFVVAVYITAILMLYLIALVVSFIRIKFLIHSSKQSTIYSSAFIIGTMINLFILGVFLYDGFTYSFSHVLENTIMGLFIFFMIYLSMYFVGVIGSKASDLKKK